jgi:outer membrane lipoprotein-sorting protein
MILFVLLVLPLFVFAQSFEQVERRLAQINTIKVSFVQKTKYTWRTKEDVAKGFFYAQKGGKFRIEYEQPEKMIIVSDGIGSRSLLSSPGQRPNRQYGEESISSGRVFAFGIKATGRGL